MVGTRSKAKTEWAAAAAPTHPTLPKVRGPNGLGLRFGFVTDPYQFDIAVEKEETTARRALPRMHIWFALIEAKRGQQAGLVSAWGCADKEVVKFSRHTLVCEHGRRFRMNSQPIQQTSARQTQFGAPLVESRVRLKIEARTPLQTLLVIVGQQSTNCLL